MADRIDIGLGPRLGPERPTEPVGFEYTGATAITPEQYQSEYVNYYRQYVGLPSLEEETGISVDTPTVEEQAGTVLRDDDDDDIPSFIEAGLDREQPVFGMDAVSFGTDKPYATYQDYLKGVGKTDRVDIVENLYSPLVSGDFKGIDLKEADIFSDAREIPDELKGGFKELSKTFKEEGLSGVVDKYGETVGKKVITSLTNVTAGPLFGIGVGGILGGTSETNAFGETSFRPSGVLGAMFDINQSRQFKDIAAINAVRGQVGVDQGFAMKIGNFGITRAPGSGTYSGNMRGLSFKQVKDLEAISKGFLPESYRFDREKDGQDSFFLSGDTKINQKITDNGGVKVDPNDPMSGFYKGDGTFYSPRFGYSKYGMRRDLEKLADKNNISFKDAEQALEDARSGKGTLASNLNKYRRDDSPSFEDPRKTVSEEKQIADIKSQAVENKERIERIKRNQKIKDDDEREQRDIREVQKLQKEDPTFEDAFNTGGFVQRLAPGGGVAATASGFVDGVPPSQATDGQEVADDKDGQLPEGAYVINASAVTFAGEKDIVDMLRDAQKEAVRRGITVENPKSSSMIDVAVSRGEVVVSPHLVNIIGKDRLEKINNRGIKDTERKIEENGQQVQGAATGGFLGMNNGGDVGEDVPMSLAEIPQETIDKFAEFGIKKQQRGDISKFIDTLTDEEAIALTLLTETTAITTPLEDMEAIAEVIKNRSETNYAGFKNVNTIKDVLKQQTKRGAYQFSGLEPSVLYSRLKELRRGVVPEGALQKVFAAAQNVLDPETEGYKRLPSDTLFYTRADAKNQWMRKAKDLEYATEIGEHEFYKTFASPEFP